MTLFLAFSFVQKILSWLRVRVVLLIGARAAALALVGKRQRHPPSLRSFGWTGTAAGLASWSYQITIIRNLARVPDNLTLGARKLKPIASGIGNKSFVKSQPTTAIWTTHKINVNTLNNKQSN
jgi:hypothetical protein